MPRILQLIAFAGASAGAFLPFGKGGDLASRATQDRSRTYANPIDLPYRFQPDSSASWREAADPEIRLFNGTYWLFLSHSLGYFYSSDLTSWTFVSGSGYAVDKFAPTVINYNGTFYLHTSEQVPYVYSTTDLASGKWQTASAQLPWGHMDPAFFLDDDSTLYLYDGMSNNGPFYSAKLNKTTFVDIGDFVKTSSGRDPSNRGWEVPGDNNEKTSNAPWLEGTFMIKNNGRYYLEFSGPGTEFKGYANGLLTASSPMGPFTYETYSPFAHKPTGFIAGAGHGSTFAAKDGNYWHVGTMAISVRHMFERRLGLWPTSFTSDGKLQTDTYLGDYPHYYDGDRGLTGWMVLSRKKKATSSSSQGSNPSMAADEDVRTWWTAASGKSGEWFQLDLNGTKTIQALQVNLADQDASTVSQITASNGGYKYKIEASTDGQSWTTIVPESATGRDSVHNYHVLSSAVQGRYVKITNSFTPNNAKFSLYDLRVFGNDDIALPGQVKSGTATRNSKDGRQVSISWPAVSGADFYIVRLGIRSDMMNQNFQIYDGATTTTISTLNVGQSYVFTIDAVNEAGITKGTFSGSISA
ncbi:hypothetical protein FANTH_10161 [Fusarium anthophilum]|uniref:Uncharacterized protein n=1 Tax=Fusarium anthophilum TaxID=48485 RepID=A0A8H5DWX3_9HYPO|nr:hypothetical protein FANTH_10161 [Fusarium anthophilum]